MTFDYLAGGLCCDGLPLADLAGEYGTPLYVYSADGVRASYRRLRAAFAPLRPLICFAVKANNNLALLDLLRGEGAGFDIVSGGELHCALQAGADPARIVFAGVGKTDAEMAEALRAGVGWVNVESADELRRLNALASAAGKVATVALRLNPGVAPDTHHHIQTGGAGNKFGLPVEAALELVRRAGDFPAVRLRGAHIHIGSQVPQAAPALQAIEAALGFVGRANDLLAPCGGAIDTLDLGGGFPVAYRPDDDFASIEDFAAPLVARLGPLAGRLAYHLEPGRYLVAEAGVLLTTVQAVKEVAGRRTLVVDAGMHTLLRPALYDAYHEVRPVLQPEAGLVELTDVVGPICESADVLARARDLPRLEAGGLLALMNAGAYGYSMASQYNAQPRPAEALVKAGRARLIRRRETYADLTALQVWVDEQ